MAMKRGSRSRQLAKLRGMRRSKADGPLLKVYIDSRPFTEAMKRVSLAFAVFVRHIETVVADKHACIVVGHPDFQNVCRCCGEVEIPVGKKICFQCVIKRAGRWN
jgi:hypothetical protein